MTKTLENLNMSDDYMFTAVLRDEKLCKRFLETILNIKIRKIKYLDKQKDITITYDNKSIRLDIYVQDENNTIYNAEMQTSHNDNLLKRARYYQGLIDSEQLMKGKENKYERLNKTFIIFICTFDPFGTDKHLYRFERVCTSDSDVTVTDDTVFLFLNTRGKLGDVNKEMIELLNYIETSTDEVAYQSDSELVQELNQKVKEIKVTEKARKDAMTLELRDLEKKEEGRMEERIKIAVALLDVLDNKQIAEKTGLTVEQVKALRENAL